MPLLLQLRLPLQQPGTHAHVRARTHAHVRTHTHTLALAHAHSPSPYTQGVDEAYDAAMEGVAEAQDAQNTFLKKVGSVGQGGCQPSGGITYMSFDANGI